MSNEIGVELLFETDCHTGRLSSACPSLLGSYQMVLRTEQQRQLDASEFEICRDLGAKVLGLGG